MGSIIWVVIGIILLGVSLKSLLSIILSGKTKKVMNAIGTGIMFGLGLLFCGIYFFTGSGSIFSIKSGSRRKSRSNK